MHLKLMSLLQSTSINLSAKLNHNVHPDEMVVHGATIYAANVMGHKDSCIDDRCLLTVAPAALGAVTFADNFLPTPGQEIDSNPG